MRQVSWKLVALLGMAFALALSAQRIDEAGPKPENLRDSDFARAFSQEYGKGYIQVTASRIFVVDSSTSTIAAYDLSGRTIGSLKFPPPSRTAERISPSHSSPQRDQFLVDGNRVYLSWRGRILSWDVRRGQTADVIEFDRSVRLLKPLEDRLVLADPDSEALFTVVDLQGSVMFRFGKPLVAARNPNNDKANRFFAFFRDGQVKVLFQYYPIYRVYDVAGRLLDEGRYETPSRLNLNPSLEVIAEGDDAVDSWIPEIIQVRTAGNRLYVYFNGFKFGVLDESFRIVFERFLLGDPGFAANPRVIDIDSENDRLLLFKAQSGRPEFEFFPIRPRP